MFYEFALLAFVMVTIGGGALFFARTTLETKLQEVTLAEIPGSSKLTALNREIRTINQTLSKLERITAGATYWSPRIAEIMERTPSGIYFNSLDSKEDGKVTIQGVARNRSDLAAFRDALGTSPSIIRIHLPLQYFVEQEQVEFTVELFFRTDGSIPR